MLNSRNIEHRKIFRTLRPGNMEARELDMNTTDDSTTNDRKLTH